MTEQRVDPYSGRPVEADSNYGNVPTLLEHLYGMWLNSGGSAKNKQAVEDFFYFAQRYLAENRPTETRADDANLIVRLSNNTSVRISPATQQSAGQMQPSNSVEATDDKNTSKTLPTESYGIN